MTTRATDAVALPTSRWSALIAFAAVGATTQLLWLTFAPITSPAAKHYAVSETAIGWLANVFPLGYVVLAIPGGLWLDRYFRTALTLGAALMAAGAHVRLVGEDTPRCLPDSASCRRLNRSSSTRSPASRTVACSRRTARRASPPPPQRRSPA